MSIVEVEEIYKGRGGTRNRLFERTYTRTFQVITDNPLDGTKAVFEAVGEKVGTIYSTADPANSFAGETDPWAAALEASAECTAEDGCSWEVQIRYGPYDPRIVENPLDAVPEVEWDFAQWERIVDEDTSGNAILNSAGDPFDPPITRDDSRPVLRVVRNLPSFDADLAAALKDKTNNDAFMGKPPRTWKVESVKGKRAYHPAVPGDGLYWVVTFEFHFDPDTWDKVLLDQGLRQLDPSTGDLAPIYIDNEPASSPVLLDGSGLPVAPGGTPNYLNYVIYEGVDYVPTFGFGG